VGSSHLKRELSGTGLALLSVFLIGALLLQQGVRAGDCYAPVGPFGPVGGALRCGLVSLVGLPVALLAATLPLVHALRFFRQLDARTDRRWLIFI
jgi:hypothetical protein